LTTSLVSARRGSARIERAPSALGPTSGRLLGRIGHGPDLEPLAGQGIGILRYRLWDIDRLVNRTLVYGLLTVLLGAVYAGLVLTLGLLSGGIGSTTPSWAVAAATLAVAALFQPARRRVQQAVDHTMRPTATSLWLRPSATDAAPAPPSARARVGCSSA
jgi:hypothetical protein